MHPLGMAAVVGSLACAPVARAEPVFDAFRATCVDTGGERTAVAAKAAGWMALPKTMLDDMSKSFSAKEADGWMRSDAEGLRILLWARATVPQLQGRDARICAMASMPPEAGVDTALQSWAAVPATPDFMPGATAYAFTVEGRSHRPIAGKLIGPEALKLMDSKTVNVAVVQSNAQMTMLGVFAPLK